MAGWRVQSVRWSVSDALFDGYDDGGLIPTCRRKHVRRRPCLRKFRRIRPPGIFVHARVVGDPQILAVGAAASPDRSWSGGKVPVPDSTAGIGRQRERTREGELDQLGVSWDLPNL